MQKQRHKLTTLLGILFLGAAGALASEMPLSGNCGYMCHVPMAGEGGSSMMAPQGLRPVEGDFSQMKARFNIKPDQETTWQKFAEAANTPVPNPHLTMKSNPPGTSMERAQFMQQLWRQRYEHMQLITTRFQDLYNILDDQQKRIADQRFGYCEVAR